MYVNLWAVFKKPLTTGLFVLICVIDAGRILVQLQSLVVISTHADRQSVDISFTVSLFVCNFVILYGYGFLRYG